MMPVLKCVVDLLVPSITIINMMPQFGAPLTNDSRVVIYDNNMFVAWTINILWLSYDDCREWCLYYKCALALPSVVNCKR